VGHTATDIGADQLKVIQEKDKYIAQALARGVSQGKIDEFIRNNPNDYHRLKDVEADTGAGASAAKPAGGAPAAASGGALAGLQAAAGVGGGGAGGAGGGLELTDDTGFQLSAPGTLRQGIGTRIPPQLSMALAGLRRVY
jgi:hypothetical protein